MTDPYQQHIDYHRRLLRSLIFPSQPIQSRRFPQLQEPITLDELKSIQADHITQTLAIADPTQLLNYSVQDLLDLLTENPQKIQPIPLTAALGQLFRLALPREPKIKLQDLLGPFRSPQQFGDCDDSWRNVLANRDPRNPNVFTIYLEGPSLEDLGTVKVTHTMIRVLPQDHEHLYNTFWFVHSFQWESGQLISQAFPENF